MTAHFHSIATEEVRKHFMRRPTAAAFATDAAVLAAAIAAAAYVSSVPCDFVFDDTLAIVDNADVRPGSDLRAILRNDFWGKAITAEDSHKSYRPLTILTFRAQAQLTGRKPEPASSHAINVLLHAVATFCVARMCADLWSTSAMAAATGGGGRGRSRVALLGGVLFALHPVHVEAVTGVVGRAELLCALFCFASAAAFRASAEGISAEGVGRGVARRAALGLGAALCFAAAVLSKETGVTLLGVLGTRELVVHLPRRGVRAGLPGLLARGALLCACAAGYALMRLLLMRPPGAPLSFASASLAQSELIRRAENPLSFVADRTLWLLSVGRVNAEYARLLLWPARLCIEYSFDCVPMASAVREWANLPGPLLLLAAAALGARTLRRAWRSRRARSTVVAAAWLAMPWLPISHVPLRLGTLVAERTLYLPSVGAVLLAVHALRPPAHFVPSRVAPLLPSTPTAPRASSSLLDATRAALWTRAGAAPVGAVAALLAARTVRRNVDWRTDASAFEAAVEACPRSAKLHQQLCTLRTGQGRLRDAAAHCDAAAAIDPEFCDVAKSRAFLALAADDIGRAIGFFNASLSCIYTNLHAYRVLMSLYDALHQRHAHNATLFEQMASTQAALGNAPYAAALMREAAALHVRDGAPAKAVAAADDARSNLGDGGAAADADCGLQYWRGQALKAAGRPGEARGAFGAVGPCHDNAALAAAAKAEARALSEPTRAPPSPARPPTGGKRRRGKKAATTPKGGAPSDGRVGGGGGGGDGGGLAAAPPPPRVLLLTFHGGVAASVRWAADRLGWSLTVPALDDDWIGGCDGDTADDALPPPVAQLGPELGGGNGNGNGGGSASSSSSSSSSSHHVQPSSRYRFTATKAQCLWQRHRYAERLRGYDLVVVGDTMPLAWPLLLGGWPEGGGRRGAGRRPRRLLLWVCNRFDYGAVGDDSWYAAVRGLASRPAVTVVSSTPLEWKYAQYVRGTPFPSPSVLRPSGAAAPSEPPIPDPVPVGIDRPSTFFVLPKVNEAKLGLAEALAARGLPVWTPGVWPSGMQQWGGPAAVAAFRAAVHVPYAPTTFALYEHAQAGLLTFLPSAALMLRLYEARGLFFQATRHDFVTTGRGTEPLTEGMLSATEWYDAANAACFVYFDSMDDLVSKLRETDYAARRRQLREWAEEHTNTTLRRWQMLDEFLLRGGGEGSGSDGGVGDGGGGDGGGGAQP